MPIRVSVVVPVYNPGSDIDACIESILTQSLPADEYEAIFVDDGSTDGSGERLDVLAAEHDNVRAVHIPNSGWPGRPRNVGIDAARGRYVYFVDNDDWIAREALERLYDYAELNGADVVTGKVVGHGKRLGRELFRRNRPDAKLDVDPLLTLLSPHKLFRREFLDAHHIRFPEGRRRLEDHRFCMQAYLLADRISVLSDYPCYHWMRRESGDNASLRRIDPRGYFGNVAEVLDLVEAHTEPGERRERLLAHWYRGKMLGRLGGGALLRIDNEFRQELYTVIRELALERYGERTTKHLSCSLRVRSRFLLCDRLDRLMQLAEIERGIHADVMLHSVTLKGSQLRLRLTVPLRYGDGSPVALTASGGRVRWQVPPPLADAPELRPDDIDVTRELARSRIDVFVRSRRDRAEFLLPARWEPIKTGADGHLVIEITGEATLDPTTAAAGARLANGTYDVHGRITSCGWDASVRVPAPGSVVGDLDLPAEPAGKYVVAPYRTSAGNLAVRIGSKPTRAQSSIVRVLRNKLRHRIPARARRHAVRVLTKADRHLRRRPGARE
jgi:glycosyltransferase involved in cell wall biosynthesis